MGDCTVPADDRAFLYGDGVFETLLSVNGALLWPELHVDRLMEGAQRLGIPLQREDIRQCLAARGRGHQDTGTVRLTVSRGSGPRGYAPPDPATPRLILQCYAIDSDPLAEHQPMSLALSSVVMSEQRLLAGIKHCNRLEQVLAAREARALGVDDVVMQNSAGEVQCTSCANLFAVNAGELLTPPCDRSGVAGTRRRLVIETLAPALGLRTRVTPLRAAGLMAADEVFITNAVLGLRRVGSLGDRRFISWPVGEQLYRAYRTEAEKCLAAWR